MAARCFLGTSLFAATVIAAMGTSALAGGAAAQPDGRELFVTNCASCHGTAGRGNGPVADSLRTRPADLTKFAMKNGGVFPSARLQRIVDGRDVVAHGTREMPVWGSAFKRSAEDLDETAVRSRIDAIVKYLETIQERAG